MSQKFSQGPIMFGAPARITENKGWNNLKAHSLTYLVDARQPSWIIDQNTHAQCSLGFLTN